MSLIPPRMPGDMERSKWPRIGPLGTKVNSLDELRELFPAQEGWGEVEELKRKEGNPEYVVYGRKFKNQDLITQRLAYHCGGCDTITIGPPKIRDDTSIEENIPLAGREGYDIYCGNCHAHLDESTWKQR